MDTCIRGLRRFPAMIRAFSTASADRGSYSTQDSWIKGKALHANTHT
jgi:hypothetical protein